MREAFLFRVGDKIDAALRPPCHGLGFMFSDARETQAPQQRVEVGFRRFIDREFDELGAETTRPRRQRRPVAELIEKVN